MNPKIVGATVIGFALVAGAYVTSNFGESNFPPPQSASAVESASLQRVSIAITDSDQNGIEDWRDDFVTSEITLPEEDLEDYTLPETLTGKTSIDFLEKIISSKIYAPFGPNEDEIVGSTVTNLAKSAQMELVTIEDLNVMEEWDEEDIYNYTNTLANVVSANSVPGVDNEMVIINDIVRDEKKDRIADLKVIEGVYLGYLEDSLKIPVPKEFAKTHLDLVNTYKAIFEDLQSIAKYGEDPMLSLLHIRRYPEDVEALQLALTNLSKAMEKYADLYSSDDPAVLFFAINPELN